MSVQAFAEELHERVRKEFWAYDVDEKLDTKQLHQIKYNVSHSVFSLSLSCNLTHSMLMVIFQVNLG